VSSTSSFVCTPCCGGPPGPPNIVCCGIAPTPTVFHVSLSGGTGSCTCLDGVAFDITWTGLDWSGVFTACGVSQTNFSLTSDCVLHMSGGCVIFNNTCFVVSCSPIVLTSNVVFPLSCCTGSITVTIME